MSNGSRHNIVSNSSEVTAVITKSRALHKDAYKKMNRIRSIIGQSEECDIWKRLFNLKTKHELGLLKSQKDINDLTKLSDFIFCVYLRHVNKIASNAMKNIPLYSLVSFEDVITACISGHIESIKTFDPTKSESYLAYSSPRIYGSVIDELRVLQDSPLDIPAKRRKLIPVIQKLTHQLCRKVTDDDIFDLVRSGELEEGMQDPLVTINTFNETNVSASGVNDSYDRSTLDNLRIISRREHNVGRKRINHNKILELIRDSECQFVVLTHFFWNMPLSDVARIIEKSHATAHSLKKRGIAELASHFNSYENMRDFIYDEC